MPNGLQPTGTDRSTGPEDPSDTDLVSRARAGDLQAFDLLVTRHRRSAYRLAWRLTGRHQEADDLSQDAFLRAWKGLHAFRGDASFGTWLTRIVVNLALSGRQARRTWVPIEEDRADPAGGKSVAEERVLRDEVRSAIDRLPPRQRQVLVLKVYEGWTFMEIGREMGIAVGTAKATFFQAVVGLRGRLATPVGTDTTPAGTGTVLAATDTTAAGTDATTRRIDPTGARDGKVVAG